MYIEQVGAVGLTSKSGRYRGTYAHSDIALNFCYWLNPRFQVYFLKEFQRLKNEEAVRLGLQFDLRRELIYFIRIYFPPILYTLLLFMIKTTKHY